MVLVTVSAEVDAVDVVGDMSDDDLRSCGLFRAEAADWEAVASAIRRDDGREVTRLIQKIAFDQAGRDLPDFSVARVDLRAPAARTQFAD